MNLDEYFVLKLSLWLGLIDVHGLEITIVFHWDVTAEDPFRFFFIPILWYYRGRGIVVSPQSGCHPSLKKGCSDPVWWHQSGEAGINLNLLLANVSSLSNVHIVHHFKWFENVALNFLSSGERHGTNKLLTYKSRIWWRVFIPNCLGHPVLSKCPCFLIIRSADPVTDWKRSIEPAARREGRDIDIFMGSAWSCSVPLVADHDHSDSTYRDRGIHRTNLKSYIILRIIQWNFSYDNKYFEG